MIAWFAAAALAATPALVPDRAVVAAPCVVDPADPCWDDAPALTRFAPKSGCQVRAAGVAGQPAAREGG